jgi:hypothetical protein
MYIENDSQSDSNLLASLYQWFCYLWLIRYLSCQNTVKVFATPLRSMKEKSSDPPKEDKKKHKKNKKKKKKDKAETVKKPKSDRFEKLEALSKRLRLCLLKGSIHRRNKSS